MPLCDSAMVTSPWCAKQHERSKVHVTVDTLGHFLTLHLTAADKQDRGQMQRLAQAV
jgi:hypothetical protein